MASLRTHIICFQIQHRLYPFRHFSLNKGYVTAIGKNLEIIFDHLGSGKLKMIDTYLKQKHYEGYKNKTRVTLPFGKRLYPGITVQR